MRIIRIASLLMAGLSAVAWAQSQAAEKEIRIKRILSSETAAILEAGVSGDISYMSFLRRALKPRKEHGLSNPHAVVAAEMALAKLGDPQQQHQMACELQSK